MRELRLMVMPMQMHPETHSKLLGYSLWIFGLGYLYDYWTLNSQISERNHALSPA